MPVAGKPLVRKAFPHINRCIFEKVPNPLDHIADFWRPVDDCALWHCFTVKYILIPPNKGTFATLIFGLEILAIRFAAEWRGAVDDPACAISSRDRMDSCRHFGQKPAIPSHWPRFHTLGFSCSPCQMDFGLWSTIP